MEAHCLVASRACPDKEAQLFARIARGYPVLSIGVAVEKGYPSLKVAKQPAKRMDSSWDWHRLIANARTILDLTFVRSPDGCHGP